VRRFLSTAWTCVLDYRVHVSHDAVVDWWERPYAGAAWESCCCAQEDGREDTCRERETQEYAGFHVSRSTVGPADGKLATQGVTRNDVVFVLLWTVLFLLWPIRVVNDTRKNLQPELLQCSSINRFISYKRRWKPLCRTVYMYSIKSCFY